MKRFAMIIALIGCAWNCYAVQDYICNFNNPKGLNYLVRNGANTIQNIDQPNYIIASEHNGDDAMAHFAGSFSKTLEHNPETGVLSANGQQNYQRLLTAIQTGLQEDFNAIVRANESITKLVNPQASFANSLEGVANALIPMPAAPSLSSALAAADMIEVYLKAICRSVHFEDYGTGLNSDVDTINGGSLTNHAAAVLTALGNAYQGPRNQNGTVTADILFRGDAEGCLIGIYVSQFLYLPLHYVFQTLNQIGQFVPEALNEFGIAWDDFIAIQNGAVPGVANFGSNRYLISGKDGGTCVHSDGPGEFFLNAANILLFNGIPLSSTLPYQNGSSPNEDGFVTCMISDIYATIFAAQQEGLKHAWAHKWRANRKLRPEAMAARIHRWKVTGVNTYNLNPLINQTLGGFNVPNWINAFNKANAVANGLTQQEANTYLLPLLFPEGSPAHPSYPAGHAVAAGACSTIVKAFFDDQALLSDYVQPVKPDPNDPTQLIDLTPAEGANIITVGGELEKLASNIALFRDFAGVHYRTDGDLGVNLGEQVALALLKDRARQYHESGFTGYELTLRNGQRVRVTDSAVINI